MNQDETNCDLEYLTFFISKIGDFLVDLTFLCFKFGKSLLDWTINWRLFMCISIFFSLFSFLDMNSQWFIWFSMFYSYEFTSPTCFFSFFSFAKRILSTSKIFFDVKVLFENTRRNKTYETEPASGSLVDSALKQPILNSQSFLFVILFFLPSKC